MPLTIPAFDQYQQPMFPLRGLWNTAPLEGDRMVAVEVDWLITTNVTAVQFSLSGNSPVALSQIAAMFVDNGACGADVTLIFPDSAIKLTVPAHAQIVAPVFTNALTFYLSAPNAAQGDQTLLQIFNSVPPPIPLPPTEGQNSVIQTGIAPVNGTTVLLAAPVSGTLNAISIVLSTTGAAAASGNIVISDGTGKQLWGMSVNVPAGATTTPINVAGLAVRFKNGLNLVISGSTLAGAVVPNLYYTTP